MSFVEEYLKDKGIAGVIHIGADRGGELGQYEAMGVEHVIWIEANPDVYKELIENLNSKDSSIYSYPFNVLISDTEGMRDFHLYYGWDAGYMVGNKGMSSLLKANPNHWSSECYKGTLQLQSYTLDSFMREHDFYAYGLELLNIDVQGAELMVLSGAKNTLKYIDYINIEVTLYDPQYEGNVLMPELEAFLNEAGFEHVVTNLSAPNWGDAIFKRKGLS